MAMRATIGMLILIFGASFYFYKTTTGVIVADAGDSLAQVVPEQVLDLRGVTSRSGVAVALQDDLGLSESEAATWIETWQAMQWAAFNEVLLNGLSETYALSERDKEIAATHSAEYVSSGIDILEHTFLSQKYSFAPDSTPAQQANALIVEVLEAPDVQSFVLSSVSEASVEQLLTYIAHEQELLPDLVPLPPQDMGIENRAGERSLVFSTIYYNAGRGNLELRGDPATFSTPGDFERDVSQRIYHEDGSYRDRPAGTFMWHAPHIHYHFADFVTYELTYASGTPITPDDTYLEKSTFCIRDVSRIDIVLPNSTTTPEAAYRICGRERQGITAGWGDAYFFSYPDQHIPIGNLPSGEYRLTFNVNPLNRLQEITQENNQAYSVFAYDAEVGTIEVLETMPRELPTFEHIYVEQDL